MVDQSKMKDCLKMIKSVFPEHKVAIVVWKDGIVKTTEVHAGQPDPSEAIAQLKKIVEATENPTSHRMHSN